MTAAERQSAREPGAEIIRTAYEEMCGKKCEWCAKGDHPSVNGGTVHKIYPMHAGGGFKDPSIKTPFSQYFRCTAPSRDQVIADMAARIAELEADRARLDYVVGVLSTHGTDGLLRRVWDKYVSYSRGAIDAAMKAPE